MSKSQRQPPQAEKEDSQWQLWWDARVAALEKVLGKSDEMHLHAMIPFDMGPELGGAADVISFSKHLQKGIVYTTSELIGRDDQVQSRLGNYELAICHRKEDRYGPGIISQLAQYTCEAALQPGETMDLGPAAPKGSKIAAFVFLKYASFTVRRRKCGLMLCLGITPAELEAYYDGRGKQVLKALRDGGIYPFTDWKRKSVM
jgi:hypothetical protein